MTLKTAQPLIVLIAILLGGSPTTRAADVDALLTQLKSEDPKQQGEAAGRLERLILEKKIAHDNKQVFAALRDLLLEGHGDASHDAAWALDRMGMPALDAALEALRSENRTAKGYGAQLLGSLAKRFPDQLDRFDAATAELRKYVRGRDPFVRHCAIHALGEMGLQAMPALIEALANPLSKKDRSAHFVTGGLARIGKPAVAALIRALSDDDPVVRRNAVTALASMKPGVAKDAIQPLLKTTQEDRIADIRVASAHALGRMGHAAKVAAPRLLEMIEQGELDLSGYLSRVTIGIELVDRVLRLIPKLETDRHHSRIARALATAGVDAIPKLIKALDSDSAGVRQCAALALAEFGREAKPAVPALIKALDKPNGYYINAAMGALSEIGPDAKEAVPRLINFLKQEPRATNRRILVVGWMPDPTPATQTLQRIGAPGVPQLVRGLQGDNHLVQARCARALSVAGKGVEKDAIPALRKTHDDTQDHSVKYWTRHALLALHDKEFIRGLTSLASHDLTSLGIGGPPRTRLRDDPVVKTSLALIEEAHQLESLDLTGQTLPDNSLSCLRKLSKLQRLRLDFSAFTDAGMENLNGLNNLEYLNLRGTRIGDASVKHIVRLTKLEHLDIGGTRVTDAGLRHLGGMTRLRYLDLRDLPVTDDGLKHLEMLTELRSLTLSDTKVTDAGLEHLKALKRLQQLWITSTSVTDEGVKKLRRVLPGCSVRN